MMSPVAMCGIPKSALIRCAWVPLPDPCGPSRRTFTSPSRDEACRRRRRATAEPRAAGPEPLPARNAATLFEEAFVGAHHHLRLHLAHGVERDADHDQDR